MREISLITCAGTSLFYIFMKSAVSRISAILFDIVIDRT